MDRTGNAKRWLLISMVAFLSVFVLSQEKCSAEQMISSPIPSKEKGFRDGLENYYVGMGYFDGKSKVRDNDGNYYDQTISQLYGILGYRFSPWTEGYFKVGSAGFEFESGDFKVKTSDKLFVTGGLNMKWYISRSYSVWSSFQGTWYSTQKFTVSSGTETTELNAGEVDIAPLAMDYRIPLASSPNLLSAYGGLLVRYSWENLDTTVVSTGEVISANLRNESYIGGFAGLRVVPLSGLNIVVEAQYIDRFSLGANLVYAFPE